MNQFKLRFGRLDSWLQEASASLPTDDVTSLQEVSCRVWEGDRLYFNGKLTASMSKESWQFLCHRKLLYQWKADRFYAYGKLTDSMSMGSWHCLPCFYRRCDLIPMSVKLVAFMKPRQSLQSLKSVLEPWRSLRKLTVSIGSWQSLLEADRFYRKMTPCASLPTNVTFLWESIRCW
jgi:hypothetical protein